MITLTTHALLMKLIDIHYLTTMPITWCHSLFNDTLYLYYYDPSCIIHDPSVPCSQVLLLITFYHVLLFMSPASFTPLTWWSPPCSLRGSSHSFLLMAHSSCSPIKSAAKSELLQWLHSTHTHTHTHARTHARTHTHTYYSFIILSSLIIHIDSINLTIVCILC